MQGNRPRTGLGRLGRRHLGRDLLAETPGIRRLAARQREARRPMVSVPCGDASIPSGQRGGPDAGPVCLPAGQSGKKGPVSGLLGGKRCPASFLHFGRIRYNWYISRRKLQNFCFYAVSCPIIGRRLKKSAVYFIVWPYKKRKTFIFPLLFSSLRSIICKRCRNCVF